MTIWGNHSATQYPDFYNAKIDGSPADEVIGDEKWLKEDFHRRRCNNAAPPSSRRAAFLPPARPRMRLSTRSFRLTTDTPANDWHSVAVCSDGSYGVEKD